MYMYAGHNRDTMITKLKRLCFSSSCLNAVMIAGLLFMLYSAKEFMMQKLLDDVNRRNVAGLHTAGGWRGRRVPKKDPSMNIVAQSSAVDSEVIYSDDESLQSEETDYKNDNDRAYTQNDTFKRETGNAQESIQMGIANGYNAGVRDGNTKSDKEGLQSHNISDDSFQEMVASQGPPVVIVIMAQWRFGSSIIGELFNQNPGIFYLYEPLWVVEQMVKLWRIPGPFSREAYFYSTKLLQDIARCDFGDKFMDTVNLTNQWGGRVRSRVICEQASDEKCLIPDEDWLRNVCLKFDGHLAVKLIRGDLGMIKPLVLQDHVNVKIIHLVRDPRGSTASRINYVYRVANNELAHSKYAESGRLEPLGLLDSKKKQRDSVVEMCKRLRENVSPQGHVPDWLRDHYRILRYEDFAEDPYRTTQELYNFVGLELPQTVKDWVIRNTQAEESADGTFDVKKNSRLTARHWMEDLSLVEIRQIESKCLDIMKLLGYQPYHDTKH